MSKSMDERFWEKVDRRTPEECWEWKACKVRGYGHFKAERQIPAHIYAYRILIGPIPEGMTLDHLCRNRGCVNPYHLEPCSRGENTLRGNSPSAILYREKKCKQGHSMEDDNVYIIHSKSDGRIRRRCRTCEAENRLRNKEYKHNWHYANRDRILAKMRVNHQKRKAKASIR